MGKTLYLECSSGISGDMTVAALLDLGADRKVLQSALDSLLNGEFRTEIKRVSKSGLDACDFHVILDEKYENHDHDMEYLHGHSHEEHHHVHDHSHEEHDHVHGHSHEEHDHVHDHSHEEHDHVHDHSHGEHHHVHQHRGLPEIREILENSSMTPRAKSIAVHIFEILAKAEAKAHGVPEDQVHFHEVGAVDSIVDIAAAAVCLDNLDITEVVVPFLCEGTGFIRCQHGVIPVPVPAVVNIAQQNGLSLKLTGIQGELVTPTGAAIVAAVRTSEKLPENFIVEKTGIGAGKRQYACPGILRAMLIRSCGTQTEETIWKLETNIDDCTGEELGNVMGRLFQAGARDVYYTPIYMKKNRPAYELSVICTEEKRKTLEEIIFRGTTTIGIRRCQMERAVLKREIREISVGDFKAKVKLCTLPDGTRRVYPEYDSAAAFAEKEGISCREAWEEIRRHWEMR